MELQPERQPENRTPAVITETSKSKKPAHQKTVPKVKKNKSDQRALPKKRMRISEGEEATSAAAEPAQPETTQSEELLRLEPETPLYSISLRGTPIRESARAAKLLITKSKSKSKHQEEETFSEEEARNEEKKTAESSTTVSSLSESEEGLNVDKLLKKEKAKKKKKQGKTKTSMSASATSVASTSSKSKPRKSASLSKTSEVEAEPVLISEEEQEAEGTVPEEQEEDFPETVAVPGRKLKGKPTPFKTADMKGKVLNQWMDLQQGAREFLNPGTPKIVGRWNDVYGHLTKINFH